MAERRMFAKSVVDSGVFLDMPISAQALYFHLSMRADDDGFVGNAKRIVSMLGVAKNDLRILIKKGFVRQFDSGVVAILHWKVNNRIQKDRYKPTVYQKEMACLNSDNVVDTNWTQNEHNLGTQGSIVKESIEKESTEKFSLGEQSLAKPSALSLAENIKHRDDFERVYANHFKLDLCDLVIDALAEQSFANKQIKGHTAWEFREYAEHGFDAEALARLVNKLLANKEIEDKKNYVLTVVAEEYL